MASDKTPHGSSPPSRRHAGPPSGPEGDSAERKKTEQALRESEERFRSLAELLPEAVFEMDLEGRLTYVNRLAFEQFRYPLESFEQGLNAFDMIVPEDRKRTFENAMRIVHGEDIGLQSYKGLKADGTVFPILIHASAILREGTAVGIRGVVIDMSEQQKANEEREKMWRLLDAAILHSPVGILIADAPDVTIRFANPAALGIRGGDLNSLTDIDVGSHSARWQIFRTDGSPFPPQDLPLSRAVLKGEITQNQEMTIRDENGGDHLISANAAPIYDAEGGITAGIVVFHDITERKRTEEALRKSQERMDAIFQAIADPIVVYDKQGFPETVNPAFTQVFGWTLEELRGRRIPFVPEDQQELTSRLIRELYETGTPVRFETKRLTRDHRILDVLIGAAIIRGTAGDHYGMVVNIKDITEHKHLEAQFRQAQKMEAIGTLTGGVAHDFNNLLMAIQGRISLLLADMKGNQRHLEHLQGMEEYVESAATLTRQLLGFAKGGKYETKSTDLNVLIREQNSLFGRTHKEIRFHEKFSAGLWSVELDRGQFQQVLLNLYVNAWQAMPGGGDLFVETANCQIDENHLMPYGLKPGRYVKLTVTDNGIGMDQAIQSRIFEPFFTTKDRGRGTGLGLASTYGIVKNHGGFINVHSEKGAGATFTIHLPASDKQVETIHKFSLEVLRGTETILLVDDEAMIIDVGKQLLETLGYTVLTARDGYEAVRVFRDHQAGIRLVILDMIMPGMGGGEVFDRLRELNPAVPVLLSSGYSLSGQAAEILKKGCNGFIQKPFNLSVLSQKIREIITN
ncbi:MAG: PAS domain-containing hybrid sensor histidine kinase/response regulator [Thermodesulfobacteriota bacterium]